MKLHSRAYEIDAQAIIEFAISAIGRFSGHSTILSGEYRVPPVTAPAAQTGNSRKSRWRTFALAAIVVWGLGTPACIYFMLRLLYKALERAMTQHGIGATTNESPFSVIPVNTLFAMSTLASPSTLKSNFLEGDKPRHALHPRLAQSEQRTGDLEEPGVPPFLFSEQ
jgi:hypothetical protein